MPRTAQDPVDKAVFAYRALTAEQKLLFTRVLRHLTADAAPKPRERKPKAEKAAQA